MAEHPPLLEVRDLSTHFYTEEGELRAVDGVSFELRRGRTLALVGESGSGKSVLACSLLRLINPPGKIVGGSVRLHGAPGDEPLEILELRDDSEAMYEVRRARASFIFQEATAALSPVHTVADQIIEAIRLHQKINRRSAWRLGADMLAEVGIVDPELCMRSYPHELSGSIRQRAVIAMALVTDPELLIADEPTKLLDLTIQAQVLGLLRRLQAELSTAILLITHDLGVVAQMADDVCVMYLGRVVERGPVRTLLKTPRHPYSMSLCASLPSLTPVGQRLPSVKGYVPALSDVPAGCPFHPRCDHALPGRCNVGAPPPLEILGTAAPSGAADHAVACWRAREIAMERLLQRKLPAIDPAEEAFGAPRSELPTLPDPELETVRAPMVADRGASAVTVPAPPVGLHEDPDEAAWFDAGVHASAPPEKEGVE